MGTKEQWKAVGDRMARSGLCEGELSESFILGSGKGGQKLQKTSSCVQIRHAPTGITIKCQQSRLREMNRLLARELLCEKIEARIKAEKLERKQLQEKQRRQKRGRSRAGKERVLEQKKRRSQIKKRRQAPD